MVRRFLLFLLVAVAAETADLKLPQQPQSVKFGIIGDSGTGLKPQYEVGSQMEAYRKSFPFDFVIMLGDNIYGSHSKSAMERKFEDPYKPLLDGGVKFFASLGNHDNPNQRFYKLFNMEGKRYYTFRRGDVQFFALDSTYMDAKQLEWIEKELSTSNAAWKICFFHHPLYSHGKMHGSDVDLRSQLEPLFEKYGVGAVFSGHDHAYERLKPQKGINYMVLGCSGQLRSGGMLPSPDTAKAFDRDQAFGLAEVTGNELHFQIVSRTGETIDSGVFDKPVVAKPAATQAAGK